LTYSDAIARGRGITEWFVCIPGTRYVLGTSANAPTDAWYTSGGYSYLQGLRRDTIRRSCTARPGEVWPDTGSMDLEFQDRLGTLGTYLKGWESVTACDLTSTLSAGDGTANVTTTTGFAAAPGVIYCDHAAWAYSGMTGTTFTGLTLTYGAEDVDHVVDTNVLPPCQPEVTDGPADLRGRRVVIYATEIVNGALSATEQQWVGYVDGFVEVTHGLVRIPVSHVVKAYQAGLVFGWVPTGRLRGLYVPNYADARWGRFHYVDGGIGADLDIVPDGTSVFYDSRETFVAACLDPVSGINSLANFRANTTSDGRISIRYTGAAAWSISIEGHIPELLGFSVSDDGIGAAGDAHDWPADVFAPLQPVVAGFIPRLYLRTGEAGWFDLAHVRIDQHDGHEYGSRRVAMVNVPGDYLEIDFARTARGGEGWSDYVLVRNGTPAPSVYQVLELLVEAHEAVRALWAGELYAGAPALLFALPRRWLPSMALRDSDVDWTELRRLVTPAPWPARCMDVRIEEPTEIAEIVTGALLGCGIYAYVKNDGTVGWRQAGIPSELDAATSVGAAWIDGRRCTDAETTVGADSLVNSVKLTLTNADVDNERQALIVDQRSLQRYGPQPARDPGDPLAWYSKRATGIELHTTALSIDSPLDIEHMLARYLAGTIFALLSRPRPVVTLPVTPIARQLAIGDVVDLTTAWAWDLSAGQMGVAGKVGLVLGYVRREEGEDALTVLLIDQPARSISPAALATAWDAVGKKLTFADTDLYHLPSDASDLTWFESGDEVLLVENDATVPSTWAATIASVDVAAGEVFLTSAPGGLTAPVVMRFADYSTATADQQGEGWLWIADDADGLIQDVRSGDRWT
jgi:hypothetical protein